MDSSELIQIFAFDETYIQLVAEASIMRELQEYFTFEAPNARWSPKFQARIWDGKIRLLDMHTGRLYRGLLSLVKKFAKDRKYPIWEDSALSQPTDFTEEKLVKFVQNLNLTVKPHDYQFDAVLNAISNSRQVLLSPTGSGKSLIIYSLFRWYLTKTTKKILILVPTVNLVNQLFSDFKEYNPSWDVESHVHKIYEGQPKHTTKPAVISTWQSVYEQPASYFEQFDCIIGDECHLLKANSIKHIFQSARNCKWRFGLTGTLDNVDCNKLVIQGLTGDIYKVTDTKTLIDREILSKPTIKCVILKYSEAVRAANKNLDYHGEMKFIVNDPKRTAMLTFLCKTIGAKENTIVLTNYIEHIEILKTQLELTGKKVLVVTGKTPPDERELIRKKAETSEGIILLVTFGVYSVGVNIKNIQNIIFATNSKAQIRTLQTIGRGLRLDGKTNKLTVYDIVDDFGYKKNVNTLVRHFFERIKIYKDSQFKYILKNINIQ